MDWMCLIATHYIQGDNNIDDADFSPVTMEAGRKGIFPFRLKRNTTRSIGKY